MSETFVTVKPITLPSQHIYDGVEFPFMLECLNAAATLSSTLKWLQTEKTRLIEQVEEHGAILFRGFPLESPGDFDQFIASFDFENFSYNRSLSNAVRINYTPRVFSANEAPSGVKIYLHHEMAQTPFYPSKLFFFCQQPAHNGGATPLCHSAELFREIQKYFPEFAQDCELKGLLYSNTMPADDDPNSGMGRSWQSTLGVKNKQEAELRLKELNYSWVWLEDGSLRATTPVLPGVRTLSNGRKVFFNQLIAASRGWEDERNLPSKAITFGDGSALDPTVTEQIEELADSRTFDVPWQKGDVAFVDNMLVMHGRRNFRGTRKVLASLVDVQHQPDFQPKFQV